ncbi:DUF397 domain-containing protein [Streptomyces sp. VNUA116]|uniref:DUF397 domain-containing protein n=1 Tax=Streptomyces sp. VNUA116 TaxID=3062449 RepID=UPI002675D97E|nr:DUF397 domain-containing protein [Streptomyces sp. VNUA116]WKU45333.1 DUF397 domain-containing protein [Streptomyces sp. VNUA116]
MSTNSHIPALEVAEESAWFKSSYSDDSNGIHCISVAALASVVAVRDSKQQNGPAFVAPTAAWSSFIREVKTGRWAA